MRLVIQRVQQASVAVNNTVVGKIDQGLFILVGIGRQDTFKDAEVLAAKVLKLRIMADEHDKMNLAITQSGQAILVVSQFTLYADTSAGNRPSFVPAAQPQTAKSVYERFVGQLKKSAVKIETGLFGEYMQIHTVLDGPVTITLESN